MYDFKKLKLQADAGLSEDGMVKELFIKNEYQQHRSDSPRRTIPGGGTSRPGGGQTRERGGRSLGLSR